MTRTSPAPVPRTRAARRSWSPPAANPLTKFAVAALMAAAFVVAVDPVSAAVALALQLLAVPWLGVRGRALAYRLVLVAGLALPVGVFTAWAGTDSGDVLLDLGGPVTVTSGSAVLGMAMSLRIAAIALPGVLLLATTDPTDLADALAQHTPLPQRFVVGALAALRLVAVLGEDAAMMRLARRARGVPAPWTSPAALGGVVLALLALALGRAAVLAEAMQARGFGTGPRTSARVSSFGPADAVLAVGAIFVVGGSIWAGIAAGTWRVVWL